MGWKSGFKLMTETLIVVQHVAPPTTYKHLSQCHALLTKQLINWPHSLTDIPFALSVKGPDCFALRLCIIWSILLTYLFSQCWRAYSIYERWTKQQETLQNVMSFPFSGIGFPFPLAFFQTSHAVSQLDKLLKSLPSPAWSAAPLSGGGLKWRLISFDWFTDACMHVNVLMLTLCSEIFCQLKLKLQKPISKLSS